MLNLLKRNSNHSTYEALQVCLLFVYVTYNRLYDFLYQFLAANGFILYIDLAYLVL